MRQTDKFAIFRLIPPKLAITLIVVAILYALLQPMANSKLGWNLPSIASILELDFSPDASASSKTKVAKSNNELDKEQTDAPKSTPSAKVEPTKSQTTSDQAAKPSENTKKTAPKSTSSSSSSIPTESVKKPSPTPPANRPAEVSKGDSDLRYGLLKTVGRDRYESPAGLLYGPGSEEGHRLKHIERHLQDQPNRPGSHGVFEGDMTAFLKAIDDAYTRAKRGAKGTTRKTEDDATVYEASFTKVIGYQGGSEGKRRKNPELRRLRIVVSDSNNYVITAFPF